MTAIIIRPSPPDLKDGPEDFMPFSTRLKVAYEINRLWKEFVTEMHDGPTCGPEVADKFWRYASRSGR